MLSPPKVFTDKHLCYTSLAARGDMVGARSPAVLPSLDS